MTIEQKPELNRFVDPSIPLTWKWRWRQTTLLLPILLLALAFCVEVWLFKAWLSSDWRWDRLPVLVGIWLAMVVFISGTIEFQVRVRQRSKRVIQIKDDRIIIKPAKNQFVRWKHILKFQFEPIVESPNLMKLKLISTAKKGQPRTFWPMVLENPTRVRELIGFLQKKKAEMPAHFEIEVLDKPLLPGPPARFPFLAMLLMSGGFFLLLHGLPLFLIGVANPGHDDSENDLQLTPSEKAKLGQFLLKHFSSVEELRRSYIVAGGALTLFGLLLMIGGWFLIKQNNIQNENT